MNKQVCYFRNKVIESLKYTYLYDLIFPMVQIIQTITWYAKNKPSSTPHLIKQKIVKSYQRKYGLKILIETGTYLGAMVNATKDDFKKIYTIELDDKLYKSAKNKFKKYQHVKVLSGDSTNVLPKLLKQINQPCLFWLDAHFSRGITAKGIKETPIMEELNSILKHKIKTHVILIDDANAFIGKKDYPKVTYLKRFILKRYRDLSVKIEYNIIIITKHQINQEEHT